MHPTAKVYTICFNCKLF